MSHAQQITQELKKVESKIHEWEDKLEELHEDRNKLERELRRNERGLVNVKEELHELRLLKESLIAKRAMERGSAGIEDRDVDELSGGMKQGSPTSPAQESPPSMTSPLTPLASAHPQASPAATSSGGIARTSPYELRNPTSTAASSAGIPQAPAGIPQPPAPIVMNTGPSSGIQVGATVQWIANGILYDAEELRFMPEEYMHPSRYPTQCTLCFSGTNQMLWEYEACHLLATCFNRWPPRNCGVIALVCLRKASKESPEGECISGGGFIRLANRDLARAYMKYVNGITCRNRTIALNYAQEFQLHSGTRDVSKLGSQRFFRQVWECPQTAK